MTAALAEFLRGQDVPWKDLGLDERGLLDACVEGDLTGLVQRRVSGAPPADWPDALLRDLGEKARAAAVVEMLRRRELADVLAALAAAGVHPVLFKGTALAYQVYESPALRPRNDTDLMVRRDDLDTIRQVLAERGYAAPAYCDGELLFCQFELQKTDPFGVLHAFDFHWKISTQTIFASVLGFDDLARESVAIGPLGPSARAAGLPHALLLACIHPVMHHRNESRLIWLYDIHLLASSLPGDAMREFTALAGSRGVAAICAHGLQQVREKLGTPVGPEVIEQLRSAGRGEKTARYLEPDRRWQDELVSNVKGLGNWTDRLRLLREVAFPSASYMLKSYGWPDTPMRRALLPVLYLHRGIRGMTRVLTGVK